MRLRVSPNFFGLEADSMHVEMGIPAKMPGRVAGTGGAKRWDTKSESLLKTQIQRDYVSAVRESCGTRFSAVVIRPDRLQRASSERSS